MILRTFINNFHFAKCKSDTWFEKYFHFIALLLTRQRNVAQPFPRESNLNQRSEAGIHFFTYSFVIKMHQSLLYEVAFKNHRNFDLRISGFGLLNRPFAPLCAGTNFHKQNSAFLGFYESGSRHLLRVSGVGLLYLFQLRIPNLSCGPKN
jgi:hypothetical protein